MLAMKNLLEQAASLRNSILTKTFDAKNILTPEILA